jgi:hypothetical protein
VKVTNLGGEFRVLLRDARVEEDFVVLKAQIGLWDSKIYVSTDDLLYFTSILLRPSVLLLLLRLPFQYLFRRNKDNKS